MVVLSYFGIALEQLACRSGRPHQIINWRAMDDLQAKIVSLSGTFQASLFQIKLNAFLLALKENHHGS
jgi:hypothetical protein